jgi:hypothetical protein
LKPIETYRLDGLTNSNFLSNSFEMWDYSAWSDDVFKTKNTQISANMKEIEEMNKKMTDKLRLTADGPFKDSEPKFLLDERFVYKIEKFDNSSLLTDLFRLNETLINLQILMKTNLNNPEQKNIAFIKRAQNFPKIIQQRINSDSINRVMQQKMIPENIRKYSKFYQDKYSGMSGLKEYCFQQQINNKTLMASAFSNLAGFLNNEIQYNLADSIYPTDKAQIRVLSVSQIGSDQAKPEIGYITSYADNIDKSYALAGFVQNTVQKNSGFIAISDSTHKTLKIKIVNAGSSISEKIISLCTFTTGYIALSYSSDGKNSLIFLDKNGNETKRSVLTVTEFPRLMKYDEINDNIICAFSGKTENDFENSVILSLNAGDQSVVFRTGLTMNGRIFDFTKMDKNLCIFANFTEFSLNGNTITSLCKSSTKPSNICMISIDPQGNVKNTVHYKSEKPVYGIRTFKLNSNSVNILGQKNEYLEGKLPKITGIDIFYSLIDASGIEKYTNWHD